MLKRTILIQAAGHFGEDPETDGEKE